MFGVIVCSRCGKVRGVDLSSRRTTCPGCGRSIDISKARVYFSTDDQAELAEAVRQMARDTAPELVTSQEENWTAETGEETRERRKLDEHGLMLAIDQLMDGAKGFTVDDLVEHLGINDREELRKLLSKLLSEGLIYEPEPGVFRAI